MISIKIGLSFRAKSHRGSYENSCCPNMPKSTLLGSGHTPSTENISAGLKSKSTVWVGMSGSS